MTTTKKSSSKQSRKPKPALERGYDGHVYWLGKTKLGKVSVLKDADPRGRYHWEAVGRVGYSAELDKARAAVELAVAMADRQLDLFE
jgi:hypothetical protein